MSKTKNNSPLQWVYDRIYLIVLVFFGVWMLFFDQNDVFTQIKLTNTANELTAEKEMYEDEIIETREKLIWVESNSEKFARENYFLSTPQEDVFIFVEEK